MLTRTIVNIKVLRQKFVVHLDLCVCVRACAFPSPGNFEVIHPVVYTVTTKDRCSSVENSHRYLLNQINSWNI